MYMWLWLLSHEVKRRTDPILLLSSYKTQKVEFQEVYENVNFETTQRVNHVVNMNAQDIKRKLKRCSKQWCQLEVDAESNLLPMNKIISVQYQKSEKSD